MKPKGNRIRAANSRRFQLRAVATLHRVRAKLAEVADLGEATEPEAMLLAHIREAIRLIDEGDERS